MKTVFKETAIRTIRALGYDLVKVQAVPYSIFTENRATIAEVEHEGCRLQFFIGNPSDQIQATHLSGSLYEPEELSIVETHYVPGTTFVDIGSNVGNHALWAAKCLGAPRVIAFEPVLGQHTLLCANIALNDLSERIEVRKIALSSRVGKARISKSFVVSKNSGRAWVSSTGLGEEVRMSTGDLELADTGPLFIKLDVEGHEISALEGLQGTINKHRPRIFIEVDCINEKKFDEWLRANKYEKRDTFKRYEANCNYLVAPSK
jgi:FkbM family methyltransferase